ncbi:MAG TPA: neutral/alkaline non-lysosomal ceramidase N-terminal domain-containing protein [Bacteroidales bacterium]|nr:neutral/alkaline non-lysosomal ceramidase N-terminal domain-containing protein [Bacteroidales bacterium]
MLFSSCAVVKTPYFQASYYKNTVNRLEDEKDSIKYSSDSLYAGFSKVSITPDVSMNVPLAGYGQSKTRYATGVHDSVFVRAAALKSGGLLSVIVSADMLLMPPDVIDTVIARVKLKGIGRNQLFFSATHTHSSIGGWGYGILSKLIAGKQNPHIKEWLAEKIITSVMTASSGLQQAYISTGSFSAPEFTLNRLTHIADQLNTDFDYMIITLKDGSRGVIGSYSAHATTIGSSNTLVSGDYPGSWERNLENSGYDLAMFCGGSMANQSPYGKGKVFESAEFIGRSLADSLLKNSASDVPTGNPEQSSFSLKLDLPAYHMRMSKNCNFPTWLSRKMMAEPENVMLQALKINNLIWFFTPGDFSGEAALLLKKILKGKGLDTVVSGYNGSYIGYILPGKYFWLKHYETRKMSWYGPGLGDYMMDIMERMSNLFTH